VRTDSTGIRVLIHERSRVIISGVANYPEEVSFQGLAAAAYPLYARS
jgi:hypothetical protein